MNLVYNHIQAQLKNCNEEHGEILFSVLSKIASNLKVASDLKLINKYFVILTAYRVRLYFILPLGYKRSIERHRIFK